MRKFLLCVLTLGFLLVASATASAQYHGGFNRGNFNRGYYRSYGAAYYPSYSYYPPAGFYPPAADPFYADPAADLGPPVYSGVPVYYGYPYRSYRVYYPGLNRGFGRFR